MATIGLAEPLGDETLVFLDYGGPTSLVAKVDAGEKVEVGDRCWLTLNVDKALFFDGQTGEQIMR